MLSKFAVHPSSDRVQGYVLNLWIRYDSHHGGAWIYLEAFSPQGED